MSGQAWSLCKQLIQTLLEDPHSADFRNPVSRTLYPYYFVVIKKPMDLGTVSKKVQQGRKGYKNIKEFAADCRLVFDNARSFNQSESEIYDFAEGLSKTFEEKYDELKIKLHLDDDYDPSTTFVVPDLPPQPMQMSNSHIVPPQPTPKRNRLLDSEDSGPSIKKIPSRSKRSSTHSSKEDSDDEPAFKPSRGNRKRKDSDSESDDRTKKKPTRKRPANKEADRPTKKMKIEAPVSEKAKNELIHDLQAITNNEDLMQIIRIIKGDDVDLEEEESFEFETDSWSPNTFRQLQAFVKELKSGKKRK